LCTWFCLTVDIFTYPIIPLAGKVTGLEGGLT